MHLVHLVIGLALVQYVWFGILVGRARGLYKVSAPAITGNEVFERQFRVQQNTLELLVILVPSLLMFAYYVDPRWAAAIGALYLVGRFVYAATYVKDPKKRSVGFTLSMLPVLALLIGGLVGAVRGLIAG